MLIAFSGKAFSGKTTAARYLRDSKGFVIVSFADALKDKVRDDFAFTDSQVRGDEKDAVDLRYGVTPRAILIAVGNLYRSFDKDFWVKRALARITLHGQLVPGDYVIDDCRFINEAKHVEAIGGHVVRLWRSGVEAPEGDVNQDQSETDLDNYNFARVIATSTIHEMHDAVDSTLTWLRSNATMYVTDDKSKGLNVI